jgi:hypothetical protein
MIGDHDGRSAGRATLLVRAVDAILGTHRGDMAANAGFARPAEAPGAVISRGPSGPLQSRSASRQRDLIVILFVLAAAARVAHKHVIVFVIVLAAVRGLVRDSQVMPRALTWLLGPAPAWYERRKSALAAARARRAQRLASLK